MSEMIFWGDRGEYGPFHMQEDGWPHAGEVIRHYRRKIQMSAEELARRYGEAIHAQVTARWILKMEQQNKVPMDITRRRILAKILDIPPLLLGLASLEAITYHPPTTEQIPRASAALKQTSFVDLTPYEQYARNCWLLSYTGKETLEEVVTNMWELEQCERQSSGDFQRQVWYILNIYYQLASDMTRHQGNFTAAWMYANNAVRVTRLHGIRDFLAAALYRRGYTSLEWAIFGDHVAAGKMNREPDKKKLRAALVDFDEALPYARAQLKGAIWLEISRAQGSLQELSLSLSMANAAEGMIDAGSNLSDPLEQILLEGALNGLNEGMYLLGKTASFIVLGRTTAIELLDDLEALKNGKGIARNQARRLAYADLLRAEASLGTKDYTTAVTRATSAFQTFQDIQTLEKIARINAIHSKLAEKCPNHFEVKSLGKMLKKQYKQDTPQ
jgi:transcriptional regulator with XRE-family HTH domain